MGEVQGGFIITSEMYLKVAFLKKLNKQCDIGRST